MAKHISVKGVVQGVGFRPFVYGLATRTRFAWLGMQHFRWGEILVDGQYSSLEKFIKSLSVEKPPSGKDRFHSGG